LGGRRIAPVLLSIFCTPARASFLSGDALDTAADWIAIVVLIVVPIVVHRRVLARARAARAAREKSATIRRPRPSRRLCCFRSCFGGCCGRSPGCGAFNEACRVSRRLPATDKGDEWHSYEMGEKGEGGNAAAR
jgi:hypothetical protein